MTKSVKEKSRLQKIKDYKDNKTNVFDNSMMKLKIKIDSSFYDDVGDDFYFVDRRIYKELVLKYKEAIKIKLIPLVQKIHIFDFVLKLEVMTHHQHGFENHNELTAVLYVNGKIFSPNPLYIHINTEEKRKPSYHDLLNIFEQLVIEFIKTDDEKKFKISKDGAFLPEVKNLKVVNHLFKGTYYYNDIHRLYNFFYTYRKEINVDFVEYSYNYITESILVTFYINENDFQCILNPISYDDRELIINIYESGIIQSARDNLDELTFQEILDEHCMLSY